MPQSLKPIEERTAEVVQATKKLFELGISKNVYPEIEKYFIDTNAFIRGADYSITGRIYLDGISRTLAYNLCTSAGIKSTIVLLAKKPNDY